MEIYIFNQPKFQLLYNCNFYDVDTIPFEERSHPYLGSCFILFYLFFMMLYIPCLWAMCISDLRQGTTYKLMIQLGFVQLIGIHSSALYTGVQSIRGVVYCSEPTFQYILCCFVNGHWTVSTITCDILGFNRLCELYSNNFAQKLFGGKKLILWMGFPFVYGFFIYMFMTPNIFNGHMMAYLSNPHYGYFEDTEGKYISNVFAIHDIAICVAEILIHIGMPILYFRAMKVGAEELKAKIRYERQIYLQVICIGVINFSTSMAYVIIQVFTPNRYVNLIANIGYVLTQGMTSVIYLCFNRSIRKIIWKKLGCTKLSNSSVTSRQQIVSKISTNTSTNGKSHRAIQKTLEPRMIKSARDQKQ